jgi:type IV pilus assembly protein PilM
MDFGAGTLKLAEFELNETGSLLLKQYGVRPLGIEGSQDSKREAVLLKAIQELLGQKAYRSKSMNVSAPGFHVFSKFVKLPPVDSSKVTQIIQYEAQQNVPFPLEEVVWDYQIMGTLPGGEMEVLLVAIKADVVESLFRTAQAAGLRLQLVDVSPAALCNAFRFNYGDLEGCTMLLDIGAKTSNLLFFEKGKVFSRGINIGANSITQDFVAEAKMPFGKAEELKINEGFVSLGGAYEEPENPHQAAISKIARQVMTRLHIQVNQTIQFYRGQQGGSAPLRVFLAGGGSIMPYTSQFFAEKLNIPVEYFNPFRSVQLDPALDLEDLAKVAHSFGEVVGLGLRNMAQCPVELNLVPKSIRSKQQFKRKQPYFIAAVFSLILVVLAYGWFYGRVVSIKQAALADLTDKVTPLQRKSEELSKEQAQIKKTKEEIDQFTIWIRDRFFWADALVEMRRLLLNSEEKLKQPGRDVGVWIETFGTVTADEEEEEAPAANPYGMMMDPRMLERYFGIKIPQSGTGGADGRVNPFMQSAAQSKPKNTNDFTINVKLRALNLNKGGETAANGKLAYTVQNEFKSSSYFDPDGTKLSGELEAVDGSAQTFTFAMSLKLKNTKGL